MKKTLVYSTHIYYPYQHRTNATSGKKNLTVERNPKGQFPERADTVYIRVDRKVEEERMGI